MGKEDNHGKKKEGEDMAVLEKDLNKRHCSPTKSLEESLKEMQLMRQGKMKKRTWKELREELKNK